MEQMTGVNNKLDRLLEDSAATREHMSSIEDRLNKLEADLKPVFFQAAAVRFSGMAFGTCLAVAGVFTALFPAFGSAAVAAVLDIIAKGALK